MVALMVHHGFRNTFPATFHASIERKGWEMVRMMLAVIYPRLPHEAYWKSLLSYLLHS